MLEEGPGLRACRVAWVLEEGHCLRVGWRCWKRDWVESVYCGLSGVGKGTWFGMVVKDVEWARQGPCYSEMIPYERHGTRLVGLPEGRRG